MWTITFGIPYKTPLPKLIPNTNQIYSINFERPRWCRRWKRMEFVWIVFRDFNEPFDRSHVLIQRDAETLVDFTTGRILLNDFAIIVSSGSGGNSTRWLIRRKLHLCHWTCPRGNGVMDSALVSHAGGRGSIPAVGVCSNGFFSLSGIGVRNKLNPDTLKWCSSVFNK